jgi:hypothetical protein
MAKLPDIKYGAVQTLHSPRAAALPGKLRSVDAAVQAVDRGVSAIDKAVETEARLDAGRRFQEAQRDYTKRRSDLVLEYHTTDKPLENFQQELTTIRQDTFSQKMPQGGRTQKYFRPDMDAFETRASVDELNTFRELTESRSKFHLEVSSNNLVDSVRDDPGSALSAIDEFNYSLVGNGLGQEENRAFKAANTQAIMTEAIIQLVDEGKTTEAAALVSSKEFNDVPQKARLALEEVVTKATYSEMDDFVQETANNLLIGQGSMDDLQTALKATEVEVAAFGNLTEEQQGDLTKTSQGEMAFRYFQGQIEAGKTEDVMAALKTEEFSDILEPVQTQRLIASATGTASDIWSNRERVGLTRTVKGVIGSLGKPGVTSSDSILEAETALDRLEETWLRENEEPSRDFENLRIDLEGAKSDYRRRYRVFADPSTAVDIMRATQGSNDWRDRELRTEAIEAAAERSDLVAADVMQFKSDMGLVNLEPMPPADDPSHFKAHTLRSKDWDIVQGDEGPSASGPLTGTEAEVLARDLTQKDTEQLLLYAAQLTESQGEDYAIDVFNQMYDAGNTRVIPSAARAMVYGDPEAATTILQGQAWLDDPNSTFKPGDISKVRAEIVDQLGAAYGADPDMRDRAVSAILAHYTGVKTNTGAGFAYDGDQITASVNKVSPVFDFEGTSVVAPTPQTTQNDFTRWAASFTADTLPAMVDVNGNEIPAEDVRDGLYDGNILTSTRFNLVQVGPPGQYYIMDNRSFRGRGGANSNMGSLLMDADHPGNPVVLRYDPANTRSRYSTTRRGVRERGERERNEKP